MKLSQIDVKNIKPNPSQPRERFDQEKINQLAESIKQVGLVHPIIVEETSPNKFTLISGERRWNAHKKAKKDKIISLVKKYPQQLQKKKELLAANQHRENLADFEEWGYIKSIVKAEGWNYKEGKDKGKMDVLTTQAELGISSSRLQMLNDTFEGTTQELQEAVIEGKITTSDAQDVSRLDNDEQRSLAKEALSRDEGMRRSEIRSTIKEIKADKLKKEYGVDSLDLERTEQDIVNDILTELSNLKEHLNEMNKKGLDMFDKSSLKRVVTSWAGSFSEVSRILEYGVKPDQRFLKLIQKVRDERLSKEP